ncbi:MAG TPA: nucleotidyltransferase domain-containing protein [Puia sp.]|nr:nucleotidyltransferase domain-containing protein [Puia sp.]
MQNQLKNKFGLTERDMQTIRDIFVKYPEVEKVFLFGSRAKGNFKQGSDIDLSVMNAGVNDISIRGLHADFEESSLPYRVELVNFPALNSPEFVAHIERVGILFYDRTKALRNFSS